MWKEGTDLVIKSKRRDLYTYILTALIKFTAIFSQKCQKMKNLSGLT